MDASAITGDGGGAGGGETQTGGNGGSGIVIVSYVPTGFWTPMAFWGGTWVAPLLRSRLWRRFGPTDSNWS
jgi:hypothetical protein